MDRAEFAEKASPAERPLPSFRANPDFDLSPAEQSAEWERMRRTPKPLERPVLVLAGYHSPLFTSRAVSARLAEITSGNAASFLPVAYPSLTCIGSAAERAVRSASAAFPGSAAGETREFDAIGISMGGLVARYASVGRAQAASRLKLRRLFTIATPHRGAKITRVVAVDRAAHEMLPGSAFLRGLDRDTADHEYELVCYAQLRDWWVGASNAAPPGHEPRWTDTRGLFAYTLSHFAINYNRTILLDIARRLRGEAPIARRGSVPPSD